MTGRQAGEQGFTLIEALAGLTVLSLVVVVIYSGFRLGARSWEAAERTHETSEEFRVVSGFVRRQLGKAFPLAISQDGSWRLWFAGSRERVVFVTEMPAYLGHGGMYQMTLAIDEHDTGRRLSVSRRLLHPEAEPGRAGADDGPRVLMDGLASAEFTFYGSPRRGVEPGWRWRWEDAERLPTLVRLRLATQETGAWPELVIRLHADGLRYQRSVAPASPGEQGGPQDEALPLPEPEPGPVEAPR